MELHVRDTKAELKERALRLRHVGWALRLVWRAAGWWAVGGLGLLLVQGLIPVGTVYVTKHLVDAVAGVLGAGLSGEALRALALPAGIMGGLLLLEQAIGGVSEYVRTIQAELVRDHIKARIHEQAVAVDLAFYESSDYHDLLSQANSQANGKPLELVNNLGGVFQNGITLAGICGVLIPFGLWIPLVLLLSTVPALYVVVRYSNEQHAWWERRTEGRRRAGYYNTLLTHEQVAPEVRIFGLGPLLRRAYMAIRVQLRDELLAITRRQGWAKAAAGLTSLLVTAGVMAYMVVRAMQGAATLGDLAMFYQAFNRGQGLAKGLLSSAGQIYSNTLFLEHLHRFLSLEPTVKDPADPVPAPTPIHDGIRFDDVYFAYPGSREYALRGFNLSVPAGQTVAVVGANGAGKSTLIKLLCRFYDPQKGRITVDGTDLRAFALDDLRSTIAALFQRPVQYQMTATDNIAIADFAGEPRPYAVEQAAQRAMIDETIRNLPQGYDTLLGKWFEGGTELSGGQWQRVSLARAFYNDAPVIVLDEPTSHLDSWAEHAWYDRFGTLANGKTAIIVTHRFTTAMRADVICVMRAGQIVEQGTHEALLDQGGLYATSWRQQMQEEHNPSTSVNGYAD
jgi:ATP-binding cassette subfamily B protein